MRPAACVSDRENPQDIPPNDVGNVVREHPKIDAAIASWSEATKVRVIGDPQDASVHLILESPSKSGTGFLVGGNRLEKLTLRLLDETDRHGINRASAARITSS